MDRSYLEMFVAVRQDLINNLKSCWIGADGVDSATEDKLADSIVEVLLELSPHTEPDATHAIYADAKSIASEVIAASTRPNGATYGTAASTG